MEQEEAAVTMEEEVEVILDLMFLEEQAVLATLVVAFPRLLPLLQQAHLVLLMAKHPHLIASTPRTSKASR